MSEREPDGSQGAVVELPAPRVVFFGEFERSLDAKNRLCLDSSFRSAVPEEEEAQGFVLTRGYDKCLALFTMSGFMKMSNQIGDTRFADPAVRAYIRDVFRKATPVKPDRQGRIVIPQQLLDDAHIKKDCVQVGARDHVEIWAKGLYDAYWTLNAGAAEKGASDMPF